MNGPQIRDCIDLCLISHIRDKTTKPLCFSIRIVSHVSAAIDPHIFSLCVLDTVLTVVIRRHAMAKLHKTICIWFHILRMNPADPLPRGISEYLPR